MTMNEAMESSILNQLANAGGACDVQLGPEWDALHDAIWNLKKLSKLHITGYDETANIVSIATAPTPARIDLSTHPAMLDIPESSIATEAY